MADLIPLIPPLIALVLILITRQAAISLFSATLVGAFLLAGPSPIAAISCLLKDHLIPKISNPWNFSAIAFTLVLGAFATLLEKSGGFAGILERILRKPGRDPQKNLLFGVYGLGLLCFFDGLANAVLLGRVGRPLADGLKVSRQFLAYVIDSTSATVACVAVISTWVATQTSIIRTSLEEAPFEVNPASLFFSSIPANPYCLLSLLLVPLVIARAWKIGPMKNAKPTPPEDELDPIKAGAPWRALVPLAGLIISLPAAIYLWQDGANWSWGNAFDSDGVPYAMIASGFIALFIAFLCFPRSRVKETPRHMMKGALSLMPALAILLAAWTLGSMLGQLGTDDLLARMLGEKIDVTTVPLVIFLLGALMSFMTGSSWGTFLLLMPIALPLVLQLGIDLPEPELMSVISMTIGAVFGGAVFGDHCSPFSDTTLVSAISSGCSPASHVATQLPYALIAAVGAALAYALMSLGLAPWLATLILGASMSAVVIRFSRQSPDA